MFTEKLTLILYNLLQKMEEDRTLPKTFYEAYMILVTKLDRAIIKSLVGLYPCFWEGASKLLHFPSYRSVFLIQDGPLGHFQVRD